MTKKEHQDSGRREFLRVGAHGVAGLAASLNAPWAEAKTSTKKPGKKRVTILVDTQTHMMPALAREMVRRNHNLAIGNVSDGIAEELRKMGAEVEVVPGNLDLTRASSMQKLVKAAQARFGGVDSACVRTGGPWHGWLHLWLLRMRQQRSGTALDSVRVGTVGACGGTPGAPLRPSPSPQRPE